jgi:hypothetical protein
LDELCLSQQIYVPAAYVLQSSINVVLSRAIVKLVVGRIGLESHIQECACQPFLCRSEVCDSSKADLCVLGDIVSMQSDSIVDEAHEVVNKVLV